MKQIGKKGKAWIQQRRAWIRSNPPDFDYYYYCYLCGKAMAPSETTLDHLIPRSRGGTNDFSNLKPCCYLCNSRKGSKVLDNKHNSNV